MLSAVSDSAPSAPFMPVAPELLARIQTGKRVVVSYPRTGSHWLAAGLTILLQCAEGCFDPEDPIGEQLPDLYKFPASGLDPELLNSGAVLKTHSWDGLPPSLVAYVTRRLEDAIGSYWTFAQRNQALPPELDLETFVLGNTANAVGHHRRLLDEIALGTHRITVTRYEDMQEDQTRELRRCAAGLDIPCSDEALALAAEHTGWRSIGKTYGKRLDDSEGVFWKGRSGSGERLIPAKLVDWIREQERSYLPELERQLSGA